MADRPPDDPELLLENVASLDTARMTLRWALERIRGLERTHAETQELLQRSFSGRQAAEGELADFKKSVEERGRKLAEKERFVGDMQKILNDLFKGEVDVSEFVKRRQALDEERATLESRVRRRLEDAEAAQKREVEENAKRLADMEGVYSASVAEAQRRFHAEVERLEREQAAALKAERERFDQFRTEAHAEGARAADEYQRRILILEHEYAGKRREMAEDLDRLKARLATEVQTADAARQAEAARAAARWDAERAQIEARLADREGRITLLEAALGQAEAAYFSREEASQAAHAKEVEALRGRWSDESAARQKLLEEAHAEITRREDAFQSERLMWVAERNELRARVAAEYEPVLEALRERLAGAAREADAERGRLLDEQSTLRRQDSEKFAADLRALESAHHERDMAARREADADLEALRRHFDEALARQRAESRKEIESHAAEVLTLRARLRQQQEELTASLEAAEKRRSEDLRSSDAASAARHLDDLERLRRDRDESLARLAREHEEALAEAHARLARTQQQLAADRASLLEREEALRAAASRRLEAAAAEREAAERALRAAHAKDLEEAAALARAAARREAEAHRAELDALRAVPAEAAQAAADERVSLTAAYEEALRREVASRRSELAAAAASAEETLRAAEARHIAEVAALAQAHQAALRAAALERMGDLERVRRELDTPSSKDAAAQIEDMTRQCRRALEALDPAKAAAAAPEAPGAAVVVHSVPRPWPWFIGAGVLAVAGAARLFWPSAPPAPVPVAAPAAVAAVSVPAPAQAAGLTLPFKNVTGLAWLGDELWATDWKEQALYRVAVRDGAVAAATRIALPGIHPSGLAVNGPDVYVSDSLAHLITRWRLQGEEAVRTGTWVSPGPQPSALFHDGTSLWSADSSQKRLYRHGPDPALKAVAAYDVEFPVVGMWGDSQRIWSADTANRLVHRLRFDDLLSLLASYGLPSLDAGAAPLSAFTFKDDQVWLARDGEPRLSSQRLADFQERPFAPQPTTAVAP